MPNRYPSQLVVAWLQTAADTRKLFPSPIRFWHTCRARGTRKKEKKSRGSTERNCGVWPSNANPHRMAAGRKMNYAVGGCDVRTTNGAADCEGAKKRAKWTDRGMTDSTGRLDRREINLGPISLTIDFNAYAREICRSMRVPGARVHATHWFDRLLSKIILDAEETYSQINE